MHCVYATIVLQQEDGYLNMFGPGVVRISSLRKSYYIIVILLKGCVLAFLSLLRFLLHFKHLS